jgi:hypothetical protein
MACVHVFMASCGRVSGGKTQRARLLRLGTLRPSYCHQVVPLLLQADDMYLGVVTLGQVAHTNVRSDWEAALRAYRNKWGAVCRTMEGPDAATAMGSRATAAVDPTLEQDMAAPSATLRPRRGCVAWSSAPGKG